MNLISLPWAAVTDGALIVGPSGRVWVFTRAPSSYGPPQVRLTDPEGVGAEMIFGVDPNATTTVIQPADPTNRALAILSKVFPHLEMIGVRS